MINKKEVLETILAERLAPRANYKPFILEEFLFKEQLDFINDPARFATAVCSVRAGKSVACAADLINTAISNPKTVGLYITLARSSAKRIIWPTLLEIVSDYGLDAQPNLSDLSLKFGNGSIIYCFGANDANEIEKVRGLSNVAVVYLDESQAFRSHIKELVEDIIVKRLYDLNGRCRMIGTPGPVPAGYFYEASQSPSWAHHAWTLHQNPWIQKKSGLTVDELIQQDCQRKGVPITDASIQRECFGRWVLDSDSLVFKYNATRNNYYDLPPLHDFVIAVDIGLHDADAIAVIGWNKHSSDCYLIEELVNAEQDISTLATQIEKLVKRYNPLKVVMDTGGLGAKVAEELRKRFALPIVAAEKTRKAEFIALTNDALRNGRFKAKSTSRFAQDALIVEWDLDKSTSDRRVMKSEPHSDICDAVLYGFREALHWLSTPETPKVDLRSDWAAHSQKLMEEALEHQIERQKADEAEADSLALLDMDPFQDQSPLSYYLNKKRNS